MIPSMLAPLIEATVLLFCGYKSFKALESERGADDTNWLTFWYARSYGALPSRPQSLPPSLTQRCHAAALRFVYALFNFAKSVLDYVAFVIPFYHEAATGFIIYCAFFGGSKQLYGTVLQPFIKQHEALIDAKLDQAKAMADEKIKLATDAMKKD